MKPTMRLAFLLAFVSSTTAHAYDPIFIDGFEREPPALAGMTLAHNAVRAGVGVGPIFWDGRLAASAQAWANQCTDSGNGSIAHNPNRSTGFPWLVGENIYASTGSATAQDAVTLWAAESQYYDYPSNSCQSGHVCAHYTQIVWANSILLGCGISHCANLTYSNSIVCDYGPAGNYIGQWPY